MKGDDAMRTLAFRVSPLVLAFVVAGCGGTQTAPPPGTRQARMQQRAGAQRRAGPAAARAGAFAITTSAFPDNAAIPKQYTADGQGISPPLTWTAPPPGTKSFALIVSDPDAPGRTYIHWVVYGLPAAARSLPGSVPRSGTLSQLAGIKQGKNSAGGIGYTPPAPPPGKVHHYHFQLSALDVPVDLAPGSTAAEVEQAMQGHILATAELTGTYQR
jgi:Raf kinase inhibitor-like YbhB/YbcL family protein